MKSIKEILKGDKYQEIRRRAEQMLKNNRET